MSKYSEVDKSATIRKLINWGRVANPKDKVTGKQAAERFHDWCKIGLTPYQVAQVANGEIDMPDSLFEELLIDSNAHAQLIYKSKE